MTQCERHILSVLRILGITIIGNKYSSESPEWIYIKFSQIGHLKHTLGLNYRLRSLR